MSAYARRAKPTYATDPKGTYLATQVGWAECNEAQRANACNNLRPHFPFARSDPPLPLSCQHCSAALRCIVGLHIMRSAQPTRLLRMPERAFVLTVAQERLSKCHSGLALVFLNRQRIPATCQIRIAGISRTDLRPSGTDGSPAFRRA